MISFCQPCLRFQVVGAVKMQYGFSGFNAPFNTRYLQRTLTMTVDDSKRGYQTGYAGTYTATQRVNRLTGASTGTGSYAAVRSIDGATNNFGLVPEYPFQLINGTPVNQYISNTPDSSTEWDVQGDSSMTITMKNLIDGNGGYTLVTLSVQLGNEYTTAQLDADADAIIGSVDMSLMPWNSVVYGAGSAGWLGITDYMPSGLLTEMLPEGRVYGLLYAMTTPVSQSAMQGVAWSGYALGAVSAGYLYANVLCKAKGRVSMLGQYCIQTGPMTWDRDAGGNLVATEGVPSCVNGETTCTDSIIDIPAPPLDHVVTRYVVLKPGGRCPSYA